MQNNINTFSLLQLKQKKIYRARVLREKSHVDY